jgi:hypothetical protein
MRYDKQSQYMNDYFFLAVRLSEIDSRHLESS